MIPDASSAAGFRLELCGPVRLVTVRPRRAGRRLTPRLKVLIGALGLADRQVATNSRTISLAPLVDSPAVGDLRRRLAGSTFLGTPPVHVLGRLPWALTKDMTPSPHNGKPTDSVHVPDHGRNKNHGRSNSPHFRTALEPPESYLTRCHYLAVPVRVRFAVIAWRSRLGEANGGGPGGAWFLIFCASPMVTGAAKTEVLPAEPGTALPQLTTNAVGEKVVIPNVSPGNTFGLPNCCEIRTASDSHPPPPPSMPTENNLR
jgi:hypothetical protein